MALQPHGAGAGAGLPPADALTGSFIVVPDHSDQQGDIKDLHQQISELFSQYAFRESTAGRLVGILESVPFLGRWLKLDTSLPENWDRLKSVEIGPTDGKVIEWASGFLSILQKFETFDIEDDFRGQIQTLSGILRRDFQASSEVSELVHFSNLTLGEARGKGLLDLDTKENSLFIAHHSTIRMSEDKAKIIMNQLKAMNNRLNPPAQDQIPEGDKLSIGALARIKAVSEQLLINYAFNLELNHSRMVSILKELDQLLDSVDLALERRVQRAGPEGIAEFFAAFLEKDDSGKSTNYFMQIGRVIESLKARSEGVYPPGFWENEEHVAHLEAHRNNLDLYREIMIGGVVPNTQILKRDETGLTLYLHDDNGQQTLWLLVDDHEDFTHHINPSAARAADFTGHAPTMRLSGVCWDAYNRMIADLDREHDGKISLLPLNTIGYGIGGAISQQIAARTAKMNPGKTCTNFAFGVPKYLTAEDADGIQALPNYYGLHIQKADDKFTSQSRVGKFISGTLTNDGFHEFPLHDPVHLGGAETLVQGHVKESYLQRLNDALSIPLRLNRMERRLTAYRDLLSQISEYRRKGGAIEWNRYFTDIEADNLSSDDLLLEGARSLMASLIEPDTSDADDYDPMDNDDNGSTTRVARVVELEEHEKSLKDQFDELTERYDFVKELCTAIRRNKRHLLQDEKSGLAENLQRHLETHLTRLTRIVKELENDEPDLDLLRENVRKTKEMIGYGKIPSTPTMDEFKDFIRELEALLQD